MYVIFPADEVVYLSYGRLIYIPTASQSENREPPAVPAAPSRTTAPSRTSQSTSSHASNPSVPSTSTSSTKSRKSTVSAPVLVNGFPEEEEPPVRPRRAKKEKKVAPPSPKQKTSSDNFLALPKSKTPERRLSFSDYLSQSRERSPNFLGVKEKGKAKSISPRSSRNGDRSPSVVRAPSPFLHPEEGFFGSRPSSAGSQHCPSGED